MIVLILMQSILPIVRHISACSTTTQKCGTEKTATLLLINYNRKDLKKNDSIADLEDSLGHESTSSDLLNARQSIIDKLSQAGFEQTEAIDIVNNIIDGLTGGSLYSSIQDDSTRRLLLNATYATVTGNERNIEAVMNDFANSAAIVTGKQIGRAHV